MKKKRNSSYVLKAMFSRPLVVAAAVIVVFFLVMAIFAPLISPYDPYQTEITGALKQPSAQHILGTDKLGRDIATRLMYGARTSLLIGFVSVMMSAVAGVLIGLVCGFYGGIINAVLSRVVDALMSVPNIMLAMALSLLFSNGTIIGLMIVLGLATVPTYARIMAAEVMRIRDSDYMTVEKVLGMSSARKIFAHLLPNCISPILVVLTANIGTTILCESSLNFLGLGVAAPTASWGGMVNEAYMMMMMCPAYALAPGICIMLLVLGFNILGDGLRDAIDPRLRGTL